MRHGAGVVLGASRHFQVQERSRGGEFVRLVHPGQTACAAQQDIPGTPRLEPRLVLEGVTEEVTHRWFLNCLITSDARVSIMDSHLNRGS